MISNGVLAQHSDGEESRCSLFSRFIFSVFLAVTIRERSFALLPRRTSKIFNSELLDLAFECGEQLFFLLVTLDFSVRFSLGLNSASTRFQSVFHV